MSTGTHTTNGHVSPASAAQYARNGHFSRLAAPDALTLAGQRRWPRRDHLEFARVFAQTAAVYLTRVMPTVRDELSSWEGRVNLIPATELRGAARSAMKKVGNIEGAALFATLAPAQFKRQTIRAQVAFQTAYNYVDALSEQTRSDAAANADQLHQALLCALHPGVRQVDYYERYSSDANDGGFLSGLVQSCRDAVSELPNFSSFAPLIREAAGRIVDFQVLNLPGREGAAAALQGWGDGLAAHTIGVYWWEAAAGAGSSLAVHALIAAAGDPRLDVHDAHATGAMYYPWGGAAHSLLDSLVDRREDEQSAQPSLLDYYAVPTHASDGLRVLVSRADRQAAKLPQPEEHRVILTAMCSYYLSAPECYTREAQAIRRSLTHVLGMPLNIAIWMFRMKRLIHAVTGSPYT